MHVRFSRFGVLLLTARLLAAASIVWLCAVGLSRAQNDAAAVDDERDAAVFDEPTEVQDTATAEEATIPMKNLFTIVRDGGFVMLPILVCSFVLLVFVFERSIALRRGRVVPDPFVKRFLHQIREGQLDREQARLLCEENASPIAIVFGAAVRKWGRPSVEVEQAILDEGERATHGLRKYLRVFHGVYTLGPLLGLLGTVYGMITCFNQISSAQAMGRPEMLASGIAQALLTTAGGLTIAVPALVFQLYFTSRVDQLIVRIDALGQELVQTISAEALEATSRGRSPRTKRQDLAA